MISRRGCRPLGSVVLDFPVWVDFSDLVLFLWICLIFVDFHGKAYKRTKYTTRGRKAYRQFSKSVQQVSTDYTASCQTVLDSYRTSIRQVFKNLELVSTKCTTNNGKVSLSDKCRRSVQEQFEKCPTSVQHASSNSLHQMYRPHT